MSMIRSFALLVCGTIVLGGCSAGRDYTIPTTPLPDQFGNTTTAMTAQEDVDLKAATHWWTSFNDPTLNELVATALKGNYDLQTVQARIGEARGLRRNAIGGLLPALDLGVTSGRSKGSFAFGDVLRTESQATLDASWEINLFGAQRALEAKDADLVAAVADYNAAALSLAAEVTSTYIDYRTAQHQIAIAQKSLAAQQESLALTQKLFKAGETSALEVSQAETLVKTTAATEPVLQQQREAARQALAALLGITATELPQGGLLTVASIPRTTILPFVDIPARVIGGRPDIIAAERRLASATAVTGVEIAALYPPLSLSSFFGFQEATASGFANIWAVAGNTALPLLNFGKIQGRIDAQKAREAGAYAQYRQTVVDAISDTETALSNYAQETRRRGALLEAAASNRETVRLAELRYKNGVSAFTDVLAAQQSLYQNELALAGSEGAQARTLVLVYRALGIAPRFIGDE